MKNKYKLISVLGVAGVILGSAYVYANPTIFQPSLKTATATTSPAYLWLPGLGGVKGQLATTTATFDSYQRTQGGTSYDFTAVSKATALIQFSGSSTLSQLLISQEDSQNGIDWYRRSVATSTRNQALIDLSQTAQWQLQFASSTENDSPEVKNVMKYSFPMEITARYARLVFTLASSTLPGVRNGAVWFEIVPQKETN